MNKALIVPVLMLLYGCSIISSEKNHFSNLDLSEYLNIEYINSGGLLEPWIPLNSRDVSCENYSQYSSNVRKLTRDSNVKQANLVIDGTTLFFCKDIIVNNKRGLIIFGRYVYPEGLPALGYGFYIFGDEDFHYQLMLNKDTELSQAITKEYESIIRQSGSFPGEKFIRSIELANELLAGYLSSLNKEETEQVLLELFQKEIKEKESKAIKTCDLSTFCKNPVY